MEKTPALRVNGVDYTMEELGAALGVRVSDVELLKPAAKQSSEKQRIAIELPDGHKLVAQQNLAPYDREIFIGIEDEHGVYLQDLACVRNAFLCGQGPSAEERPVAWRDGLFEVLVWGDENNEDFTEEFCVALHEEDDDDNS